MTDIATLKAGTIRRIHGPTILLASGTYFDFERPDLTPLTLEDVAYGLAYTCRFAGQCVSQISGRRVFYSVAEHCVRMSWQVPPGHAMAALMHDVGEAVCGDMTSPLKSLCPDFVAVEKRCEAALLAQFGVVMSDPQLIKLADLRMLATERHDLMPQDGERWSCLEGIEPYADEIEPWGPDHAARAFLLRHEALRVLGAA